MNIHFEALLEPAAVWALDRLRATSPADYTALGRCISALERNPYPPPFLRAPLVIPGGVTDPHALACGRWRISYHVEDDAFVVIERLGRAWPPRP